MVSCLLIEKNTTERKELAQLLTGLGLDCVERGEAEEGLRYCSEQSPDVVVMEASGSPAAKDFLRLARKGLRRPPVVIFYADEANLSTIGETIIDGAAEFLIRPFDGDLLQFKLTQAGVFAKPN